MDGFWDKASAARGWLARNAALIAMVAGAAACRVAFGWALAEGRATIELPFDVPTVHHVVVAGELVAWGLLALWLRRAPSAGGDPRLMAGALGCLALGTLGVCACSLPAAASRAALGVASCALVGAGRAATMVVWVEALGRLAPRLFVFGLSGVYLADLAGYWFLEHMDMAGGAAACLLSLLGALAAYACAGEPAAPGRAEAGRAVPARSRFPVRTLLWCTAFSLAYGLGSSYTGMGNSSLAMHLGYALPAAILVFLIAGVPESFDLRSVFSVSLALMTAGLLIIAFLGGLAFLPQVFMSAALACVYILMFTIVCARARRDARSPAFEASAVLLVSSFAIQAAKAVGELAIEQGHVSLVAVALIAVIAAGYALVGHEGTYLRLEPAGAGSAPDGSGPGGEAAPDPAAALRALAKSRGLTERERAVYELLLQGKGIQEIADLLFIAPSTVRAHASRVYEKFGVHSRQEFDALVMRAMAAEGEGGDASGSAGGF